MNRREFLAASSVTGAAILQNGLPAFAAPTANIEADIDASTPGEPITPLIFGAYREPATTQVWAEMLTDRKFANAIVNAPPPASTASPFRRFLGEPFRPVGTVDMDT